MATKQTTTGMKQPQKEQPEVVKKDNKMDISFYVKDINKQRKKKLDDEFAAEFGIAVDSVDAKFFYNLEGDKKKVYEMLLKRYEPINPNYILSIGFVLKDGQKYPFEF